MGDIAVIGGGSWGTALVKLLLENQSAVHWWVRRKETEDHIRTYHRNPNYLSYLELDASRIQLYTDIGAVLQKADTLIFAVPAAFLPDCLEGVKPEDLKGKTIVSAIKGIVPEENLTIGNYFRTFFKVDENQIGIIAGPCHSEEVAMEKLSFLTIAFNDPGKAEKLMTMLSSRYMRIKATRDVSGVEYAAVLKNIFAIANGICVGLGYGDNFQSVLIVNAIQEARRFLEKVNIIERDINDAVYTGDLIVTAYSKFSRNRIFGHMIGKGYSVKFAQIEMRMVAEGYYAAKGIWEINRQMGVYMPIADAVHKILYEKQSASVVMGRLAEILH
ncbi:MAG TPA: NAD(P)H-dependent glycerol-3-phosphate dehydrogenase [Bacteroidales bacterium]|nr:NAD(P)H-dependent glycerol-3-phosphate dehydrogenase [Bacteroidales bacterium]